MVCENVVLGMCIVKATPSTEASIFGFGEFITALALLVVVYTVTDIRYRFRIAITPGNLFNRTFISIGVIGFSVLLTEVWIAQRWYVLYSPWITQALLEGLYGGLFLLIAMIWIYRAFIRPPIFSERNYKRYFQALYRLILKGSETELPVIADELARSAEPLIQHTTQAVQQRHELEENIRDPGANEYAHDILLLIANKKFCRHIITSSQPTAIVLFETISKNGFYNVPAGQFAHNIVEAAIKDEDSLLYHEKDYYTGTIGHFKPFSHALFADYFLVERLNPSPLDVDYIFRELWNEEQLGAYTRCVLITLGAYLEANQWGSHSYSLYRAFETIKDSIFDISKYSSDSPDFYNTDARKRLTRVVGFVEDSIELIAEQQPNPTPLKLRVNREDTHFGDIYDLLAELIFETINVVSYVKGSVESTWSLHHNSVWGQFFDSGRDNEAWKVVQFKVRRRLFDKIKEMERFPNFFGIRILGYCLNVMGLTLGEKTGIRHDYYALQKVVIPWAKGNYLQIRHQLPDVADACLIGGISFDSENNRLVKTYSKGLESVPGRDYLELDSLKNST